MLGPKGQFYLRAYNPMKFIVPGANIKFNKSWKDECIVVGGDWGHSVNIGGIEYLVPT